MKMKKTLATLLAFVMLVSLLPMAALAAWDTGYPSVKLAGEMSGEQVKLAVKLGEAADLSGMDFVLTYPADKLSVSSAEQDRVLDETDFGKRNYPEISFSSGEIRFAAARSDNASFAQDDEIMVVNFDVASGATGDAEFALTTLHAAQAGPGNHTYTGAELPTTTVTLSSVTPTPGPWTVTFNANGHGTAPAAQTVNDGEKATKPADLTADGWDFGGWYKEAACTNTYDFSSAVTADVTVYAKWTEKTPEPTPVVGPWTVTFNANGHGTAPAAQTVNDGAKATKPADLTSDGWDFGGWYKEAACTNTYDFSSAVTADVTVYAKWTEKTTITITYVNGNGESTTKDFAKGATADEVKNAAPAVTSGYEWPTFSAATEDHTYTAFKPGTVTINVSDNGNGSAKADKTSANYGDTITLTITPDYGYKIGQVEVKGNLSGTIDTKIVNGTTQTFKVTDKDAGDSVINVTVRFDARGASGGGGGSVTPAPTTTTTPSVTVNKADNGTVTASTASPKAGDVVTVTVAPDEGYKTDKVSAVDANGKDIAVEQKDDGTYSFTVPANSGNIKVTASFVKTDDGNGGGDKNDTIRFDDVPDNAWFAPAVNWAVGKNITNGTSATKFSPNAALTRGQAVTFLWRALGEPTPTGVNPFTDVAQSDYFFNAVVWAAENGVTVGTSADTFSPNATVTRGQLVTFLYRLLKEPAVTEANPFSDVDSSAYYGNAVIWAAEAGIVQGYPDGTFKPANTVTRAEMVQMLYNGASMIGLD